MAKETALTVEDFEDLIGTEINVDMVKLCEMTDRGVPKEVRGDVWKYLLSVSKPDKSDDMSQARDRVNEYKYLNKADDPDVACLVSAEIKRYQPKIEFFKQSDTRQKFQKVMLAFLLSGGFEYKPGYVHLMGPLVYCLQFEADMYYCFKSLVKRQEKMFTRDGLHHVISMFMKLFRAVHPQLYSYFEEEELDPNEWVVFWMQFLLGRELPLECVLRLWDSYFASDLQFVSLTTAGEFDGFQKHVYVCLSILDYCQEDLLELEHPELRLYLANLPVMDMEVILLQASNIQDDFPCCE